VLESRIRFSEEENQKWGKLKEDLVREAKLKNEHSAEEETGSRMEAIGKN
jgi:hypothetical protein